MAWSWTVALLVLAALVRGELAGWLLIATSYLLVAALCAGEGNHHLRRALFLAITLCHFISLFNVYFVETWIGAGDAETFHVSASANAASASSLFDWAGQTDSRFYVWFLSKWYMVFGAHLLVGQALSILAFLGALVLVYRIALLCDLEERHAARATLVVGLLPSTLMFVSNTVREPWKILLVTLLVFASLRYFRDPSNLLHFGLWVVAGMALPLFHDGFDALLPVLLILPYLLLPSVSLSRHLSGARVLILLGSLAAVFWLAQNPLGSEEDWVSKIVSGEVLAEAEMVRAAALYNVGRASYGVALDTSSPLSFGVTALLAYVAYLAAPFPWQIRAAIDVYGFADVLVGLAFLGGSLWAFRKETDRQRRRKIAYLLAVFSVVSFVHALGTANYGTSIRHRQLTTWITIVLGWPYVAPRVGRLLRLKR
jgi:hypothetical protein